MILNTSLFGNPSGSAAGITAYKHFDLQCVKKRMVGQRVPPLQLADYSSWFSAIAPWAAYAGTFFWVPYMAGLRRDSNYQSGFIRQNYPLMFPEVNKWSARYTWGTVPPFIVQDSYISEGLLYWLIGSGPQCGAMPLDIVDIYLYWPGWEEITFWGGGFPREWFPAWMCGDVTYHGFTIIVIVSRYDLVTYDLIGCSDSLCLAVP
jgi:hypothetical protein